MEVEVTGPGPWCKTKILPNEIDVAIACEGGPNDGSTLNNEAEHQTLNGPSVLYDRQHFSTSE